MSLKSAKACRRRGGNLPRVSPLSVTGGQRTNSGGLPRLPDGTRLQNGSTCVAHLICTGADRHSDRPNGGTACALARSWFRLQARSGDVQRMATGKGDGSAGR